MPRSCAIRGLSAVPFLPDLIRSSAQRLRRAPAIVLLTFFMIAGAGAGLADRLRAHRPDRRRRCTDAQRSSFSALAAGVAAHDHRPGAEPRRGRDRPDHAPVTSTNDWDSTSGRVGLILLGAVSVALTGVAMTTLAWMLHAWRTPQHLEATGFVRSARKPSLSFSLLVPARHEEEVLGDTLDKLAKLDHPDYEVIAIIGHDDPGTEAVARAAADRHPGIVRVVMDYQRPQEQAEGHEHGTAGMPRRHRRCLRRRGRGPHRPAQAGRRPLHGHPSRRGPGRCPADEHRIQLVGAAQLHGVLLLVPQPAALPRRRPVHPARWQHRLRPGRRAARGRTAGTPNAWPRTANWVSGCRPGARRSSWPTTPRSSPAKRPRAR